VSDAVDTPPRNSLALSLAACRLMPCKLPARSPVFRGAAIENRAL
jgi:hypothetical protein